MPIARKIAKLCSLPFMALVLAGCTSQGTAPELNKNGWSEQTWNKVYIDETAPQPAQHDPRDGMFNIPSVHVAPNDQKTWQNLPSYNSGNFVMPQETSKPTYNEIMPWGQMPHKQAPANSAPSINSSVIVNDLSAAFGHTGYDDHATPQMASGYGDLSLGATADYHVIYYPHGITNMAYNDKKYVTNIAQKLSTQNQTYIRIIGHASAEVFRVNDPVQKKMINLEVGMKRALNIAKIFHQKGISPEWVEIVSLGDTMPNTETKQLKQSAADRRAEIFIQSR